jgi:anaerobic ribonucleoside-triphosphate reductase activating protein
MNNIYVTLQSSINSDGLWYPSISIYYSGCDKPVKCKDCHNPELQQCNNGFETTSEKLIQDIEKILIDWLDTYEFISICYLGGEPLSQWNRQSVLEVSKYFRYKYPTHV